VLALVRTVQQAGIIAGASTAETSATVMQLGQALASGRLQGDELRSVLENMPTLAEALARELGASVGELRKMGEAGKLTADVVMPALIRAGQSLNAEFEKMPPTMGRAFSILGEAMSRFAGDLDRALGLSQGIARAAQAAAAAVNQGRVAVGLGTPMEQASAGYDRSRDRLAVLDQQIANAEAALSVIFDVPFEATARADSLPLSFSIPTGAARPRVARIRFQDGRRSGAAVVSCVGELRSETREPMGSLHQFRGQQREP
jgi:tape measure domain-containing protein